MALRGTRLRSLSAISLGACLLLFAALVPAAAQSLFDGITGQSPQQPKPKPQQKPAQAKPKPATTPAPVMEEAVRKANETVVTVMGSGRLTGSTQVAEDIANVLESLPNNELRIMPIMGKTSEQNLRDMLYLKGMDMAVIDQGILEHIKKKDPELYASVGRHMNYVTKLFNTELHIYARAEIKSLEDLKGKKISCQASTAAAMCESLFQALKIDVQIVYNEDSATWQKVLNGEVDAAALGATPAVPSLERLKPEDNLHFLAVNAESLPDSLKGRYQQAWLRHQDYPNLIPAGEDVPTIAATSLLIVYAWPAGTYRYQLAQKFVTQLFDNMAALRKGPRHPKWREVNIAAEVPGWTRFPAAQEWLDARRNASGGILAASVEDDDPKMKAAFQKFVDDYTKATGKPVDEPQKEALYTQFTEWWLKTKKSQ